MGEQTETYQRTCQKGPSARFQRPLPTLSGHCFGAPRVEFEDAL